LSELDFSNHSVLDVLSSEGDSLSHPFEESGEYERVGFNFCKLDSFDVVSDPVELLIELEGIRLGPKWLIEEHSIEELLIDEIMSFLPTKLISVHKANLFSFKLKEVKDSLPNSLTFNDFELSKSKDFIHPFWNKILFSLNIFFPSPLFFLLIKLLLFCVSGSRLGS
jgi:hypothetical protein